MAKRAANGDGTLRQRQDGRWEYMIVVGYDENQKAIRKSFYGKNKTEAKRKYKEWLQKPEEIKIERAKTFEDWAAVWLEVYKKDKVSYGTYRNYKLYVDRHIIPYIGKLKFEDIRPAHIENVMKRASGLSSSAKRHIKIALNGIFETAIENRLCKHNPCSKIKIAQYKMDPEVFSTSEIKSILSMAKHVPDGYIVELLLYTGLRLGEAAALQWVDIYDADGIIEIRRAVARKEGGGYEVKAPKSGRPRQIGITPKLADLLKRIPRNGIYVLSQTPLDAPSTRTLERRYMAALAAINDQLPDNEKVRLLTAHKCRHTYATYLLRGGANLRQVQQLLGHSNVSITEIYTKIDTEDIKSGVEKLPY